MKLIKDLRKSKPSLPHLHQLGRSGASPQIKSLGLHVLTYYYYTIKNDCMTLLLKKSEIVRRAVVQKKNIYWQRMEAGDM